MKEVGLEKGVRIENMSDNGSTQSYNTCQTKHILLYYMKQYNLIIDNLINLLYTT